MERKPLPRHPVSCEYNGKTHQGISTPKHEMDIGEGRLKLAKQHSEGAGS